MKREIVENSLIAPLERAHTRRAWFLMGFFVLISVLYSPLSVPVAHAFTITTPKGNALGLVGYWTFDGKDMKNGMAADVSGNGNNANLFNIATSTFYTTGKIGQGARFDGVDDYASTTANTGLDFGTATNFSVSFWAKFPTTKTYNTFLSKGGGAISNSAEKTAGIVIGYRGNDKQLRFFVADGTNISLGIASYTSDSSWHHIVVVYNRTGNQTLYKDGVSFASASMSTIGDVNSPTVFKIGSNRQTVVSQEFLDGSIDDVRIYNRALSVKEITGLYNEGAATKQAVSPKATSGQGLNKGLVGYWTFDGKDMKNGVLADVSGNGNNGALINIATSTFYTAGKIGQAGRFDGINDFASTTLTTQFGDFTACAWFKGSSNATGANDRIIDKNYAAGFTFFRAVTNNTSYGSYIMNTSMGNITLSANVWHHMCLLRRGSKGSFYGDAGRVSILNVEVGSALTDTSRVFIGAFNAGSMQAFVKGMIDDVRIYNRALSATEITQLYNIGAATKVAVSPSQGSGSLTQGLVSYWTFDGKDMANGVARDVSGNGNNGNLISIATSTFYKAGKIGQGANFDGVDDFVNAGNSASVNLSDTFSVSAWIKQTATANASVPVGKVTGGSAGWMIYQLFAAEINFFVYNYAIDNANAGVSFRLNQWDHVVGVSNPTQTCIYVNGALKNCANKGAGAYVESASALQFDSYFTTHNFKGSIDDVRIYNRALSAGEIRQLYNTGK
ncbi:MAG: LamG domain-containing protein [bacterium]|nr:LamG domain-containing protein [bacterium]